MIWISEKIFWPNTEGIIEKFVYLECKSGKLMNDVELSISETMSLTWTTLASHRWQDPQHRGLPHLQLWARVRWHLLVQRGLQQRRSPGPHLRRRGDHAHVRDLHRRLGEPELCHPPQQGWVNGWLKEEGIKWGNVNEWLGGRKMGDWMVDKMRVRVVGWGNGWLWVRVHYYFPVCFRNFNFSSFNFSTFSFHSIWYVFFLVT